MSTTTTTNAKDLERLRNGVVKITANPPGGMRKVGTGFIIRVDPDVVYIVTAAHVVAGDAQPDVEFFPKRNLPVKGAVLPGAETEDDVRGLAIVLVRGKEKIPEGIRALEFLASSETVSIGEEITVIGHPGGAGAWTILKRTVANRGGRDIAFDPDVSERFSGGPMLVDGKVTGIVTARKSSFGLGVAHKSVVAYLQGFGIQPQQARISAKAPLEQNTSRSKERAKKKPLPKRSDQPPRQQRMATHNLSATIRGKDSGSLVLVPAGEFTMGGNWYFNREQTIYVDSFYIDQYEVTVEQYTRFLSMTKGQKPEYLNLVSVGRDAKKPIVGVTWYDANNYCEWWGRRLPTEAEWEKAARGTDRRNFPWGNSYPDDNRANFGKLYEPEKTYSEKLIPVDSNKEGNSPYGAYGMAGNAWEWVADWYEEDYHKSRPKNNPRGPSSGSEKILRGGSWNSSASRLQTLSVDHFFPDGSNALIGFRCAQDAP